MSKNLSVSIFRLIGILAVGCFLAISGRAAEETSALQTAGASGVHHLRAGDVVEVQVFGEPELAVKSALDPDGNIALTLVGKVKLAGKTPEQASQAIRQAYQVDYLRDPLVTVQVTESAKNRVTVLGQVKNPGVYTYPTTEKLNILQAIARAGGYTRIGEPSRVTVKRVVNGKEETIPVDTKAMAREAGTKIFDVLPEDTITVHETRF